MENGRPLNNRLRAQDKMQARIEGFDLARAVAIIMMMFVNFECAVAEEIRGPVWLVDLITPLEGMAVPVFIMLAGIGLSLMTKSAVLKDPLKGLRRIREVIVKRAIFLFAAGMCLREIWSADILHYYGIYLLIGAALLGVSTRKLLPLIPLAMIVSVIYMVGFDVYENFDWDQLTTPELGSTGEVFEHLFLLGFYPVLPWIAFFLTGIILGRYDLTRTRTRLFMAVSGGLLFAAAQYASSVFQESIIDYAYEHDILSLVFISEIEPWPATPLYMMTGFGLALMIISFSLTLQAARPHGCIVNRLVRFGQLSLTFYVAHIVLGIQVLRILGFGSGQTFSFSLACSLLFITASFIFLGYWQAHFKRGPLEWLMRRLSGPNYRPQPGVQPV